jgi:hypothetical protein
MTTGKQNATKHYTKKSKPKPSKAYNAYWTFAAKRQNVFQKRLIDAIGPWSDDPVIRGNRFTNIFRASDRVSQYLIRLQYSGDQDPAEIFFRTLLFKMFNRIETYEYLRLRLGDISWGSFSFDRYNDVLSERLVAGHTVYSAAYIMPSAGSVFGYASKHSNHLALLAKMMKDKVYERIAKSTALSDVFDNLLSYPSLGSFLAFQYTIDLNYSSFLNFSEMDFVVAGPGAKNGIGKCFESLGDYSFEDVIRMVADEQEQQFLQNGYAPQTLWGRPLQLIDCQNIFCEVDKYLRVTQPELSIQSGRTRIKQKFTKPKGPMEFFFPPKWNINHKIETPCQQTIQGNIFSSAITTKMTAR